MDDSSLSPNWGVPLFLSVLAGLSTCIGAAVVFCYKTRKISHAHMAFSLALAGSVMITVCLASILPECFENNTTDEALWNSASFCVGCALYYALSKCAFPEPDELTDELLATAGSNDLELQESLVTPKANDIRKRLTSPDAPAILVTSESKDDEKISRTTSGSLTQFASGSDLQTSEARRAWRVSMLLFISLGVHNFPEGLAVAVSSLQNTRLGMTTTVAIALHNIPEGIAISIPCLAARPDAPWLAFGLSSLSGLAEPLGAFVALTFLRHQSLDLKLVLSFVAGIMVSVACVELVPEALRHTKTRLHRMYGIAGALLGVVLMIGSEAYLNQ